MSLIKRIARAAFHRLNIRVTTSDDPDADLDAKHYLADIDTLIKTLGLTTGPSSNEKHSWATPPRRVLIMNATSRRLDWLKEVAPNIELIASNTLDEAIAIAPTVDGIIGWYAPAVIAQATRLRWLQVSAAGVENIAIDKNGAREALLITNMQKAAAPAIAEHAMALLFSLSRGLNTYAHQQARQRWRNDTIPVNAFLRIQNQKLLVVGFGGIGRRVAEMAHGVGMRVQVIRSHPLPAPPWIEKCGSLTDLSIMASNADFLVNALPLTPTTLRIFDRSIFSKMKSHALFINVGRGETVDTSALTTALANSELGGAGLDVVDPEPLPRGHALWTMKNVVITPHIASFGIGTRHHEWLIKKENLRRFASGEPLLSVVDVRRGY